MFPHLHNVACDYDKTLIMLLNTKRTTDPRRQPTTTTCFIIPLNSPPSVDIFHFCLFTICHVVVIIYFRLLCLCLRLFFVGGGRLNCNLFLCHFSFFFDNLKVFFVFCAVVFLSLHLPLLCPLTAEKDLSGDQIKIFLR